MAKLVMSVKGFDGQIDLLVDRVMIQRPGLWNTFKYGFNSKREIPLAAISEIAFRDANPMRMGEIEFVRGGRSSEEKKLKKATDTAVRFRKRDQKQFEKIKEKTFELMAQFNQRR